MGETKGLPEAEGAVAWWKVFMESEKGIGLRVGEVGGGHAESTCVWG